MTMLSGKDSNLVNDTSTSPFGVVEESPLGHQPVTIVDVTFLSANWEKFCPNIQVTRMRKLISLRVL